MLDKYYDKSYKITGAIFEVSHNMGPGLLEAVYKKALTYELSQRGFKVECEKKIRSMEKNLQEENSSDLEKLEQLKQRKLELQEKKSKISDKSTLIEAASEVNFDEPSSPTKEISASKL